MTVLLNKDIGNYDGFLGMVKPHKVTVPHVVIEAVLSAELEQDFRLMDDELPEHDARKTLDAAQRHLQETVNGEPGVRTKQDFDKVHDLGKVVTKLYPETTQ